MHNVRMLFAGTIVHVQAVTCLCQYVLKSTPGFACNAGVAAKQILTRDGVMVADVGAARAAK
jgi:hypothetical protein